MVSDIVRAELEGLRRSIGIAANSAAIQPNNTKDLGVTAYPIPPDASVIHNQLIVPDGVGTLVLGAVQRDGLYCFARAATDAGTETRAAWLELASRNALRGPNNHC
ncbi:hypothetical protein ACTJI8_20280 [Microbacterium sp. 22303]|uniref:hypothetical protein n=1 Tax=Microbacterium sp. 22303 TaxID=3453905 RepID=UPI003F87F377